MTGATVTELWQGALGCPPPSPVLPRPRLSPLARLDVEQVREFLMGLDGRVAGADLPRAVYLLGLLEGHARNLLDVVDAITEVS